MTKQTQFWVLNSQMCFDAYNNSISFLLYIFFCVYLFVHLFFVYFAAFYMQIQPLQLSVTKYNDLAAKAMNKLSQILDAQTFSYVLNESDGVLTYKVPAVGDYVLNKQPGNMQIWVSSPLTGPKKFYIAQDQKWYNTKDSTELKAYVENEMQQIRNKINANKQSKK